LKTKRYKSWPIKNPFWTVQNSKRANITGRSDVRPAGKDKASFGKFQKANDA